MENINYPLLHYQLKENAVLGILVGTDYQVVDKDLRAVKSVLSDYLQKQYKKNDTYPYFDIESPRLKVLHIKIRPTFRERRGSYPFPNFIKVPVPVVYGQVDEGYYECFLPLLQQSFYYYDAHQFESLVQHFATNTLNQYTPEKLFQMVQYPDPDLDLITLRVNSERQFNWGKFEYERKYKTLQRLAERFPYPKHLKRVVSASPETAWEMEDIVSTVLSKILHTRSNVLIVGNPGVGKSAVLTQAIRKITQQTKKQSAPFTFWRIMPQRITASAKYLGDWEETAESLVQELELANGLLWIIDMIQLLLIGGQGPEDSVAAFLLTYLRQGKLQLIGEATPQELESMRRLLPGFVEHFQVVSIDDPSENKVQSILQHFINYAHQTHRVDIEPDASAMAYRLLLRFYPYESFPGKGIKFLGQCISEAKLNNQKKVDKKLVIDHFVKQTGLPESFLRDDLLLDQQELRNYFQQRIIGQPAAVDKLCEIVKIFKAGLNNPSRPISTLIFAGPTGVGKTASAKALADYFFGKGQKKFPLIRIDMSEFQHPSQINRLIGAGREVGQLVKEIREKPFSVLLLDEVEKANPSIFDALLTVLDEGMLTDAYGRVTNFRNAIIIMTTNLGASNLQSIGFSRTTGEDQHYRSAIERHFRPEFINRIDGIVFFSPLGKMQIRQIALKELEELKKREGFQKRGLSLDFTKNVVDHLSRTGFDERYGARPLQRALEQGLISPIANWLLEHPEVSNQHLRIDYDNGILIKT
jgi:ATP-dependent Clp protease ATP-binding subunit ClpC